MTDKDFSASEKDLNQEFLRLFLENQGAIYAFILSMVTRTSDADDIMQETATKMLERFEDFQRGSNFGAWGVTIARYKIMEYHNEKKRNFDLVNKKLLEQISHVASKKVLSMEDRLKALELCLSKLDKKNRGLIHRRYHQGFTIKKIAGELKKPVAGIYKVMSRLHVSLSRCITMTLSAWEQGNG